MEAKQGFILVICSMILAGEVGKWWIYMLTSYQLVLAKIVMDYWFSQNITS